MIMHWKQEIISSSIANFLVCAGNTYALLGVAVPQALTWSALMHLNKGFNNLSLWISSS
jgi:hypothetical protein